MSSLGHPKGTVLVTGASGFVGRTLTNYLVTRGFAVRGAFRSEPRYVGNFDACIVGEINGRTEWSRALHGADFVIHCAGCANSMPEDHETAIDTHREVNTEGTRRLAEQAALAGVRRLVFVSSVKVNGDSVRDGRVLDWRSPVSPEDTYGDSKAQAERALHQIAARTSLEVVIVRPPLVYGRGVKGNFARLINLVRRGIPLPLASVNNRRAMVALDNLVDLLTLCVDHPQAAGGTFLVSDGEDLSTPDLLRRLGRAMGRTPRLLPCPVSFLRAVGKLLGRRAEFDRLLGSLPVDIQHTKEVLDWQPILSVDKALIRFFSDPDNKTN